MDGVNGLCFSVWAHASSFDEKVNEAAKATGQPLEQRQFANGVRALPYLIKVNADGYLIENSYNIKSVGQWKRVLVDNLPLQDAFSEGD